MGFSKLAALTAAAALFTPALGQTWSKCDPLKQSSCPADPALGGSTEVDFTSGQSSDFKAQGDPTYGPDGSEFTVAKTGDAPTLISDWYIMFGRVDMTLKTAPGDGIVSSFVMQSDDLDEIDVEWIGAVPTQVQTNFFGKGVTGSYNRGANFDVPDSQADFHTYSIDWNAERLEWLVDGKVIRTLHPDDFPGQYPQSPMQIKFGTWSGGDPKNNPPGTVQWAHGPTDYSAGPFTMTVQSISVKDYSTGTQYTYGDQSGTWQSIDAEGGQVNGDATGSSGPASSSAPKSPTTSSKQPSEPSSTLQTKTSGSATVAPTGTPSQAPAPGETTTAVGGGSGATIGYTPSPYKTGGYTPTKPGSTTTPSHSPSPVPGNDASGKQVAWGLSMMCAFVGVMFAM